MRCTLYRADPATLIAALSDGELLARYRQHLADETPALADRALVRFLRQLTNVVSQAIADGFDRVAERDTAAADVLLTDLFAVATWQGWPLPVETLRDDDLPLDSLPRGLLGADGSSDGAQLFVIDGNTLALCRNRLADSEVAEGGSGSPVVR